MFPRIRMIVAMTADRGIGYKGMMPWEYAGIRLVDDMTHFRKLTSGTYPNKHAVMMGKNTWNSLPILHRPLRNRVNCVLTKDVHTFYDKLYPTHTNIPIYAFDNMYDCIEEMWWRCGVKELWVIGGGSVYKQLLQKKWVSDIWITRVGMTFPADTYFPSLPSWYEKVEETTNDASRVAYCSGDYKNYIQEDTPISLTFERWENIL